MTTPHEPNYQLKLCNQCIQMTNHVDDVCQKCKVPLNADRTGDRGLVEPNYQIWGNK